MLQRSGCRKKRLGFDLLRAARALRATFFGAVQDGLRTCGAAVRASEWFRLFCLIFFFESGGRFGGFGGVGRCWELQAVGSRHPELQVRWEQSLRSWKMRIPAPVSPSNRINPNNSPNTPKPEALSPNFPSPPPPPNF